MTRQIDYFFTTMSPWSYLGHDRLVAMARRHGATIRFKPVQLGQVFSETGGLPLAKRHPARQRYRLFEMRRWRDSLGLPLVIAPKHFPLNPTLPDCCAVALEMRGRDPGAFVSRIFAALWAQDRDIADEAVIAEVLREAGEEPAAVLAEARGEAALRRYEANREEAVARGVFGAPTYLVEGEPFWGQDRLELLEAMLASGRSAYAVS